MSKPVYFFHCWLIPVVHHNFETTYILQVRKRYANAVISFLTNMHLQSLIYFTRAKSYDKEPSTKPG